MSERSAMFLVFVGMIMAMTGLGGVENSFETLAFMQSLVVAIVGVCVMGCGVLAIRVQQNG